MIMHARQCGWLAALGVAVAAAANCTPTTNVQCPAIPPCECAPAPSPGSPAPACPDCAQPSLQIHHFGSFGSLDCHADGTVLKIRTDRSNLWLSGYDSPHEEHFRIALPIWRYGQSLLVTATNERRSLGLFIDAEGSADLYVTYRKHPVKLRCPTPAQLTAAYTPPPAAAPPTPTATASAHAPPSGDLLDDRR